MSDISGYQISKNNYNNYFMNSGYKRSIGGNSLQKTGSFFMHNGVSQEVLLLSSRSGSNNLVRLVHDASLVSKKQNNQDNRNNWNYENNDDLNEFKLFLFNAMSEVFFIKKQLNKDSKIFIGIINGKYELRTVLPNVGRKTVKDKLCKSSDNYNKQLEIIEKSIDAINRFHQIKLGGANDMPDMPDIDYLEGTPDNQKKDLDLMKNKLKLDWQEFFAKKCRFVHRDLKPDNICVDKLGNYTIIDFEFVCQNGKKLSESERFCAADNFAPRIHYWPFSEYQKKISNQTDFYNFMIFTSQYCKLHKDIKTNLDNIYITKMDVAEVKNMKPSSSCYNYYFIKRALKKIRAQLSPDNKKGPCISGSGCFSSLFRKAFVSGSLIKKQKVNGPIINSELNTNAVEL